MPADRNFAADVSVHLQSPLIRPDSARRLTFISPATGNDSHPNIPTIWLTTRFLPMHQYYVFLTRLMDGGDETPTNNHISRNSKSFIGGGTR